MNFGFFFGFKTVMPITEIAIRMMRIVRVSVRGVSGVGWGFWFGGVCSVITGVAA